MIDMNVGRIILLFFTISWIITHLGENPVRGGRPPKDSSGRRIMIMINGEELQARERERVVELLLMDKVRNIDKVSTM